jgi:Mlc titration factor MtfA (ptsG expression regulator)
VSDAVSGFGRFLERLGFFSGRRRERLLAQPLSEEQRAMIERQLPAWRFLGEDQRRRLEGLVQVFLDEVDFEGCGGLEMTEEIRVVIAARACLLVLGSERVDPFPKMTVVLVYPSSYSTQQVRQSAGGLVHEGRSHRLGESHSRGQVVLSWDDVEAGARDPHDGHDVVLHEFAHQLDQETPSAGSPRLRRAADYAAWARVLGGRYADLVEKVAEHRRTFLDDYGATNPAEFFAVATEAFFEKSRPFRRKLPKLYEQLQGFYGLDPASWR